jgi:6-phosphogluconolactonase
MRVRLLAVVASVETFMPATHAAVVYVGNSDSEDVTVLALRPNGELTTVQTVRVEGPDKPGGSLPLAVSPDKRRLYVALRSESYSVVSFSIDADTGELSSLGRGPLPDSMCYIVTDRAGKFLLGASYGGHKAAVSPLGADGVVQTAQQIVPTQSNAHCILPDPSNRYVLITSLGGDCVHQMKFDAVGGRLTPNDPPLVRVRAGAGPRHLVFSPDAKFVYVLNELDGSLYVFPWDAGRGTLQREIQIACVLPKDFSGKPWAADIHVTPDGRFLYASERTSSTLAAFAVKRDTGKLRAVGHYPTEKQPRAFDIDPSGRYLLAVGQLTHSLTCYAIDPASGALARPRQYAVGKNPNWVEIVELTA